MIKKSHLFFCGALSVTLLGGCIAYTPSTSDWHKTPKIVLQACATRLSAKTAVIVLHRSGGRADLGFDFKNSPKGKTVDGQQIFEAIFEAPSTFHEAIGVQIEDDQEHSFFVFKIPYIFRERWSEWVAPIAQEAQPRREIDRYKYMRERPGLDGATLEFAPRIRYRLEYPIAYDKSSRTSERYEGIPGCK